MVYLNTFSANNEPIRNAVELVKPITNHLFTMYNRSTKKELYFVGTATFVLFYKLSAYFQVKQPKLNSPPTIPFSLPFLGHTLYMSLAPKLFLDWCFKNYGEVYNLHVFGGKVITAAIGKSAEEALKAPSEELSLDHGLLRDVFYFDYIFEPEVLDMGSRVLAVVTKDALTSSQMPEYIPAIQRGLESAVNTMLPEQSNVIHKPSLFFQNFVAFMSVPTLLGSEFGTNKEVIETFARFAGDMIRNIPVFLFLPKILHPMILPYIQTPKKHQKVMETHIGPVVSERRQMKLEDPNIEFKQTCLQGLIDFYDVDENGNEFQRSVKEVSHATLLLSSVSVHTTSTNLSFSIYWLLARPDLMEKMMAEINLVAPENTLVDAEVLDRMPFLNNFIREVLRQSSSNLGVGKKVMQDFTFSNGYQVPKGRLVESSMRQLNFGNNTIRTKIEDMDPNMSHNKHATAPARNFASFGMGKHLCPGRFFAVQEIKLSLVHLLRNFDIKTVSGKKPIPVYHLAGRRVANSEEPLIFTAKK